MEISLFVAFPKDENVPPFIRDENKTHTKSTFSLYLDDGVRGQEYIHLFCEDPKRIYDM